MFIRSPPVSALMVFLTASGSRAMKELTRRSGFTLIELLVVMAIIATLLMLAVPRYFTSLERSKEAVLKENLSVTREAIDKFFSDTGRYPDSLEDLVSKRYLRQMPIDPITEKTDTWVIVEPSEQLSGNVYDIHSGASGKSLDGFEYSEW